MMRSLFSGVSGLKNHQTRMDVIGNNISNVNTTGFKSSRVTFADMISQTLTGASRPTGTLGGTNPKQIGLGSAVSSIDLLFTNGSVQSTGKNTDLCLSGDGLFAVSPDSRGEQKYYTRNGAFSFDADGNYVQPGNGMHVLGYMAENGVLSKSVTPIKIKDTQKTMEGVSTQNATYVDNLNADTKGTEIGGILVKYVDGKTETVTNYNPEKATGLSLTLSSGEEVEVDETAGFSFTNGTAVAGKALYTKKIDSVTATAAGSVTLELSKGTSVYSINGGSTYTPPALTSGTYKYGDSYTLKGTITAVTTTGLAPGHTKLTVTLTDGNVVTFEVPEPTGTPYANGQEVSFDFKISKITAAAGAKVNLANDTKSLDLTAPLTVTDEKQKYTRIGTAADGTVVAQTPLDVAGYKLNGKRVESVTLQGKDGSTHSGLVGTDYAANSMFYPSLVSTVTVYGSQGRKYDVPVLLTKTKANTWKMSLQNGGDRVTVKEKDGSTTTIQLEDKKDLVFDPKGRYVKGGATLRLSPTSGDATPQLVTLNFSSLTQYAGSNTVSTKSDGYAAGRLDSVSYDTSGVLTGTYSNGVKQTIAQVAVAKFANSSGLTKMGDSLYEESNNSGQADIKAASEQGCKITPSALEMSNVDVANEFTDMIITQRGFQSNSKIITVSDEMLETLVNMKR